GRADPGEVTQQRKMQMMGDEGDCRPGQVLAGPCGLHICGGGTAQPCAKGLPGVFVPGYGADPGAVSQNPGLCEQGCVLPAGPFQCFRGPGVCSGIDRSEEHTSELQSRFDLVCRLLLDKKKTILDTAY